MDSVDTRFKKRETILNLLGLDISRGKCILDHNDMELVTFDPDVGSRIVVLLFDYTGSAYDPEGVQITDEFTLSTLKRCLGDAAVSEFLLVFRDAFAVVAYRDGVSFGRFEYITKFPLEGLRPDHIRFLKSKFGAPPHAVEIRANTDVEIVGAWITERVDFVTQALRQMLSEHIPRPELFELVGSPAYRMKTDFEGLRASLYGTPEATKQTTVSSQARILCARSFVDLLQKYATGRNGVDDELQSTLELFFRRIAIELVFVALIRFVLASEQPLGRFFSFLECPLPPWNDQISVLEHFLVECTEEELVGKTLGKSCDRLIRAIVAHESDFLSVIYEQCLYGKDRQSKHGQFYTPREAISFLYNVPDFARDNLIFLTPDGNVSIHSVLDPACGSGGFLVMYVDRVLQQFRSLSEFSAHQNDSETLFQLLQALVDAVTGFEIDPHAIALARLNTLLHCLELIRRIYLQGGKEYMERINQLAPFQLHCLNTLTEFGVHPLTTKQYRFVVANPPYLSRRGKNSKGSIFDFLKNKVWDKWTRRLKKTKTNVIDKTSTVGSLSSYHWFLLMGSAMLHPAGRLIFVIPPRWMQLVGFCKLLSESINIRQVFVFRQGVMFSAFTDACALVATGRDILPPNELQVFSTTAECVTCPYQCFTTSLTTGRSNDIVIQRVSWNDTMWKTCGEMAAAGWTQSVVVLKNALENGMTLSDVVDTHTAPHVPPKCFFVRPLRDWTNLLGPNFRNRYSTFYFVPIVRGSCIGHYQSQTRSEECEWLLVAPKDQVGQLQHDDPLFRYLQNVHACYDAETRLTTPKDMQAKSKKFTHKAFKDHLGVAWDSVNVASTSPVIVRKVTEVIQISPMFAFQGKFSKGSFLGALPIIDGVQSMVLSNNWYVKGKIKGGEYALSAWWNSMLGTAYILSTATTSYTNMMGFPEEKLKAVRLPFESYHDPVFANLSRLGRALFQCASTLSGVKSQHFAWMYEGEDTPQLIFSALQATLDDYIWEWAFKRGIDDRIRAKIESSLGITPHQGVQILKSQSWWHDCVRDPSETNIQAIEGHIRRMYSPKLKRQRK